MATNMSSYDRLGCKLLAIFKPDSITDKSIYRIGKIVMPYKSKKQEFIYAVHEVIRKEEAKQKEQKEQSKQLKLIA
ncbi:MAG: hypothetical protein IPL26_30160 [Leptospiraceae bacterium]|nr:hypothetical protein [Leptospiraceae bacterium]